MAEQKRVGCRISLIQAIFILLLLLGSVVIAAFFTMQWARNHVQTFVSEIGQTGTALETFNKTPATSFLNAQQHLTAARAELETLRPVAAPVVFVAEWLTDLPGIGPPAEQVVNLWLFADALTQLGESLMNAAELGLAGLEEDGTAGLVAAMPTLQGQLQTAEVNFSQAQAARTRLEPNSAWWLPDGLTDKLAKALSRWDELSADFGDLLAEVNRLTSIVEVMLGSDEPATYLLLLQSSDELRASGGFINSVGTIRIEEGKITELTLTEVTQAEETIDADWSDGSREIQIKSAPDTTPPPPFTLYMGLGYWILRDANWWADFPTTAHQAVALWKDGQHTHVDGVIAINDQFVQRLIEAVGPVPISDGTVVNDKNVKEVTLNQVYGEDDQVEFYKEFGLTLINVAKELPPKRLLQLGKLIGSVVSHRDLMVASFKPSVAATLHNLGVDGALQGETDDYLYLVEHNVSYNKLNPFIQQDLTYKVELGPDARPTMATLTINEANGYIPGAGLPGYPEGYYNGGRWNPLTFRLDRLEGYYGGYSRLYLPVGSRVMSVIGFDDTPEIGVESNRVVVGGYVGLLSNSQRKIQFKWIPSSRPTTPGQYRLLVQRQPGAPEHALSVEVRLPAGYDAADVTPPPIFKTDDTITWYTLLDQDQIFSLRLEAANGTVAKMAMTSLDTLTTTQPITMSTGQTEYGRAQKPVWLEIPAINVNAPIVAVGLEPSGIMASPTQADLVGWYELGPRPGEPSNAILAGHVDWNGKIGAFSRLHELEPGDIIEIKSGPEISYQYGVESINSYPVDVAPIGEIFGETPGAMLTLITCGGAYDAGRQEYEERIVVRARGR